MRLYLLQIQMYDYENTNIDTESESNVYSSFEKAKEEGLKELSERIESVEEELNIKFKQMLEEEKLDYTFCITEIADLEYAENFDIKNKRDEEYYKLEPTHKRYELDFKGNIICFYYEYRYKNSLWKTEVSIKVFPEDLQKGASEKFKLGDIVKLKNAEDYNYLDDNIERIYVVRYLPRKLNGEKYFENKYALISLYENDLKTKLKNEFGNKELFTFDYFEKDIEKYTGEIKENSEYDLLSKIVKGELKVSRECWNKIKNGQLSLDLKNLKLYKE